MKASRAARTSLCILALAMTPMPAAARQKSDLSLITVSGQAEIRVPPDEAIFSLEVARMEKELPAALQKVDESVRQILALARGNGVAAEDVKTDYISVGMRYNTDLVEEDGDETRAAQLRKVKREFVGYAVSKTVVVRLKDLTRFDKFFSDVLAAGVSRVGNVDFRTSQMRKYKDEARAAAIRAAREKAVALAAQVGQTIGRAHSIQEDGFSRGSAAANYSGYIASNMSPDENSAFAPGTITVTAQVTVSFLLN